MRALSTGRFTLNCSCRICRFTARRVAFLILVIETFVESLLVESVYGAAPRTGVQ
jgi:hypothetical protein